METLRLAKSGSRQFSDLTCQGVDDSPTRRVGELATPRLAEFSYKHSKSDQTRLVRVSFFDCKYLYEFKAKIGTARKVV